MRHLNIVVIFIKMKKIAKMFSIKMQNFGGDKNYAQYSFFKLILTNFKYKN